MHASGTRAQTSIDLLEALQDHGCAFRDDGRLVVETYAGTDAVVCTDCGVPAARFFCER